MQDTQYYSPSNMGYEKKLDAYLKSLEENEK